VAETQEAAAGAKTAPGSATAAGAASAGDDYPVIDPEHKSAYRFERRGEDMFVASRLDPGAILPKHKHPVQEEHWWVETGEVEIFFNGSWQRATAAEGKFIVKPGMVHGLRNRGAEPATLGCDVFPALDLEEFLTEASWAAREGLIKRGGIPGSIAGLGWAARFLGRHSDQTVMSFPPPIAIKAMRIFRGIGDVEYPGRG